jgi:hypothetical protein
MKGFGLNVGLEFFLAMPLARPPVIRRLLIIQVPDTSDKRGMPLIFRPIDCFSLRFEVRECVVPKRRLVDEYDGAATTKAPLAFGGYRATRLI